MTTFPITISVEPALRDEIDKIAALTGNRNRSKTVARLLRVAIAHEKHRSTPVAEPELEDAA